MNKKLRAFLERKAELTKKARSIGASADKENRDLTDEEKVEVDAILSELDNLNASIAREEQLIEAERTMQSYEIDDNARIEVGQNQAELDDTRGFNHFGEFAQAVMNVSANHITDERLNIGAATPSTYGNESTGADGGFLIPPEFSRSIWELSLEDESFITMTDNMPISGNSMVFPSDETTPWGTDGVRAYWEGEAAAATQTKPVIKPNTMRLKKLMALIPVTDELMSDAFGLPSYLLSKASTSIRWKANDAIINGDGVGKPLGLFGHSSQVSQAKETSQTADTIVGANVTKMFSRALRPGRSVWLINPDAFPQLPLMVIGDQPVYMGPQGMSQSPGGTLLGRPVILTDTCQKVGDKGDIQFIDFGNYRTITKAGGVETATSMHLFFDSGAMAFRVTFRIDGQPILANPVTPPNSSVTRSCNVVLANRA